MSDDHQRPKPISRPWRMLLATALAGLLARAGDSPPKDPLAHRIGAYTRWIAIGTVGGAILAGVAAVAVWIQLGDSRQAFEDGNRAWLAFVEPGFQRSLDDPNGPLIIGHYQNVGRTPALDLKTSMGPSIVSISKPLGGSRSYPEVLPTWAQVGATIRGACLSAAPLDGANVAFPSVSTEGNMVSPITGKFDLQAIKDGRQVLVLVGCLTYRSFNHVRHTGF